MTETDKSILIKNCPKGAYVEYLDGLLVFIASRCGACGQGCKAMRALESYRKSEEIREGQSCSCGCDHS